MHASTPPSLSRVRLAKSVPAVLILYGLWVLMSGKLEAFHLIAGALSVALVYAFELRLPAIDGPGAGVIRPLRLIPYFFWLLKEMVFSAIAVAKVILNPDKRLDPTLVAFECPLPSEIQAVVYANSITLTPGTLSLELVGRSYLIHALERRSGPDLLAGKMAAKVAALSGAPLELPLKALEAETFAPAS